MRVLLLNTYHYRRGGAETHVLALAEMLRSHGHEVRFFGMKHPHDLPGEDDQFWVSEIDFEALNKRKTPAAAWQVVKRTFYSFEARQQLERLLDDWLPDVAHIHNIHGHVSPSVLDSLAAYKVPVVWTLHDYRLLCPDTHFLSRGRVCEECRCHHYSRCVVNRCKKGSTAASTVAALEATVHRFLRIPEKVCAFIAPSMFLCSKFVEFGYPAEKITFIRNFLPEQIVPCPPQASGPALYFGQLAAWKGVETAITAMAALPDRVLRVVGGGPEQEHLEQLAEDLGVKDRVIFTGPLDREGVLGEISMSAFVVVPSVWYENCPYSVMEAQAAGRPLIVSDIGGLPELVAEGENGLVVAPRDADALAEAMRSLWEDAALLRRFSKAAVEESAEYDPELYYRRLIGVYESLACRPATEAATT